MTSLHHRLRFSALLMMPGHSASASVGASDEPAISGATSSARGWLIPRTMFWNFDKRDRSPTRDYKVDLTGIRTEVGGGGSWLNHGAPGWHDHLIQEVGALDDTFGLDGNFFDAQPNPENDLHTPPDGIPTIAYLLSAVVGSELLPAAQTWLDLSPGVIPLAQTPEGPNHWSRHWQRRFAHLSLGEPDHGSTRKHELGQVPYDLPICSRHSVCTRGPLLKIPTALLRKNGGCDRRGEEVCRRCSCF